MIVDRRHTIGLALAGLAVPAFGQSPMSARTAYSFSFVMADGKSLNLAEYAGKPILVVNTATLCGFAPQMTGLETIWIDFRDRGLLVIGVPSNDFGGQEPGADKDIVEAARHQHGVSFPIAAKAGVRGPNAHPFYKWAATERPKDLPRWNFHKYLIGRDGHVAEVFASQVEPADTRILTAIAGQLANASFKG